MRTLAVISLLLITLFSCPSCVRVLFLLTGAHDAFEETNESIFRYMIKHRIDTSNALALNENEIIPSIMKEINAVRLFDRDGYSIDFNSSAEKPTCGGNILGTISGIGPITYFPRDSSRTYATESRKWVFLRTGDSYSETNSEYYDYHVVYYWNLFAGKSHSEKFIKYVKLRIAENPRVKIKLHYINQDMRTGPDYEKQLKEYKAEQRN